MHVMENAMAEPASRFLGAVLKAVACTPNKNFDSAAYERGVVEPTRRIRKLSEEFAGQRPSDAQVQEVMSLLLGILQTKQVDLAERQERIAEILDQCQLRPLFPNLLPLPQ